MHPQYTPRDYARFWDRVAITNGCWVWLGARDRAAYGHFRLGKRIVYAHRAAWMLLVGPIPDGSQVLHSCPGGGTPWCVRPGHLYLGNDADNTRDKVENGRLNPPLGEANGMSILSEAIVREIKRLWETYPDRGYRLPSKESGARADIARRLGIDHRTVANVIHGRTWKHVA